MRLRLSREQRMIAAAMAPIRTFRYSRLRGAEAEKFRRAVHYYRRFLGRKVAA